MCGCDWSVGVCRHSPDTGRADGFPVGRPSAAAIAVCPDAPACCRATCRVRASMTSVTASVPSPHSHRTSSSFNSPRNARSRVACTVVVRVASVPMTSGIPHPHRGRKRHLLPEIRPEMPASNCKRLKCYEREATGVPDGSGPPRTGSHRDAGWADRGVSAARREPRGAIGSGRRTSA